jgi:glycosyltransferase involved in cell wall biosynthesis
MGDEFTDKIVIGLCTFKRNELLKEALDSLTRIEIPTSTVVEFILVDNDQSAGARSVFDAYMPDMPFRSYYFVEEKRGLSCVRNRVIEEALKLDATAIAMFDDDEIVAENWLVELYKAYRRAGTAGVAGTVYRELPEGTSKLIKKFWSTKKCPEGLFLKCLPTSNCLFSTTLVRADGLNIRFDELFNFSGREDLAFSLDAKLKGARFSSAPQASVTEKFPAGRSTIKYLLKQWFGMGLSNVTMARRFKWKIGKRTLKETMSMLRKLPVIPFLAFRDPMKAMEELLDVTLSFGWICGLCGKRAKYYLKHED